MLAIHQRYLTNSLPFQALHPYREELLAYRAQYCRLCVGRKEGNARNQVIQIECHHSNESLSNNEYPLAIINHIYHFDNKAESEVCASFLISTIIQTQCLAQAQQRTCYPRYLESICKCQHTVPRPAAIRAQHPIHLQHHACQDAFGSDIFNLC